MQQKYIAKSDNYPTYELGIRANLDQFIVQLVLVFFVGITIGLERNIIPKSAEQEFGISNFALIMTFVISFGLVKGLLNLYGGHLSETYGRKKILVLGWLIAIPVPIMIIFATSWFWIVFANILLGINQGLAWSMTVTSKIDIAGKKWRGLAIGVNEWAGYSGVAVAALVGGYLASEFQGKYNSIRTAPFIFGMIIILIANFIAIFMSKETIQYAKTESENENSIENNTKPSFSKVFLTTSLYNKTLFTTSQAGLIEKFVDVIVWVGFPLYFSTLGLPIEHMGLIVASYGFTWGFLQLVTGSLSDKIGRKPLIFFGMIISGIGTTGIVLFSGLTAWLIISSIIGLGMAMLYPTLLAVISDVAEPTWRATSLGVYRMWRDGGYAIGALVLGLAMQVVNIEFGFYFTTFLMILSAFLVLFFMDETKMSHSSV